MRALPWLVLVACLAPVAQVAAQDGAAPESMSAGTRDVRLRDLDQRVDRVRYEAWRSRVALQLLQEQYMDEPLGAVATVRQRNELGPFYRLIDARYALDGVPIFAHRDLDGDIPDTTIYTGAVATGAHTLTVSLRLTGDGQGIFSYLDGYRWQLQSSHSFVTPSRGNVALDVVLHERPDLAFVDRPTVRILDRPAR